jgi:hypothetical protein
MIKTLLLGSLLAACLPLAAATGAAQAPGPDQPAGDFTVTGADGQISLSALNARSEGPLVAVFSRGSF